MFEITSPSQAPLSIDVKGTKTTLEVSLEPYTLNDAKCGSVIYEFSMAPYDAFGAGHASVSNNKVTFSNINLAGEYPLGK